MKNALSILLIWMLLTNVTLLAQTVLQPWQVVDRGGGSSVAGGMTLRTSVGQPAIQPMSAALTSLEGGYLPGVREFTGVVQTATQPLAAGWNLLSIPVLVNDFRTTDLYPSSVSRAFVYLGSYQQRDTLANGVGFWMKSNSAELVAMTGSLIQQETVGVRQGWNIIGSPSYPALTSSIAATGTAVVSNYFGYSDSYYAEDTLKPGFGYWVKVSSAGSLLVNAAGAFPAPAHVQSLKSKSDDQAGKNLSLLQSAGKVSSITFTDANFRIATLYFTTESREIDSLRNELPPPAPLGSVDVRFASNRLVESADRQTSKAIPVILQGMEYPLTMEWNVVSGESAPSLMIGAKTTLLHGKGHDQLTRPDARIRLVLESAGGTERPKAFALEQNYPNPFNPSTVIRYALPNDSRVSLKIFNMLGQEIVALIDGVQEAGYKSVGWSSATIASGVYFYRLEAASTENSTRYQNTRKMVIVK